MIRQKLFDLKVKIQKYASRYINNHNVDYLKELKKERRNHIFKTSFKNSMQNTIFGIICIIIALIIGFYTVLVKDSPLYFIMLALIIEFTGFALVRPFHSELKFINLYYNTYYSIMHILNSNQNKKKDSYIENF